MKSILLVATGKGYRGVGSRAETYSDGTILCPDCGGSYSDKVTQKYTHTHTQNLQRACITGEI